MAQYVADCPDLLPTDVRLQRFDIIGQRFTRLRNDLDSALDRMTQHPAGLIVRKFLARERALYSLNRFKHVVKCMTEFESHQKIRIAFLMISGFNRGCSPSAFVRSIGTPSFSSSMSLMPTRSSALNFEAGS